MMDVDGMFPTETSSTPSAQGWLDTLPTEIKILIMCQLDDPSLPALIRASPIYRQIFKTYRSEIHTAVTLNTLRARKIDLELQTPLCWLEVSTEVPEPREYKYEPRSLESAMFAYRRQFLRENPRRKFSEHCYVCHRLAAEYISCDENFAYHHLQEAQNDQASEEGCVACREDVIDGLEHQFMVSRPIRLIPEHCTALCTIQDVVGWYWPDTEGEIYCFERPAAAAHRFPLHTYRLMIMESYCSEKKFWEMLASKMYAEDPWFKELRARNKINKPRDIQYWIELERNEPMDRSTLGAIHFSTTMDWIDKEGLADAWNWLRI